MARMFNVYVKIGYLRPADSLHMQNPYKLAGSKRSEQSVVKEATLLCLSKKPAFNHDSGGSVCCAVWWMETSKTGVWSFDCIIICQVLTHLINDIQVQPRIKLVVVSFKTILFGESRRCRQSCSFFIVRRLYDAMPLSITLSLSLFQTDRKSVV